MSMSDYDPDQATAREDLCRFLSACYYEPCPEFDEEHLFDAMLTAATRIHPDLADHARKLGAAFTAQDLQTLLVDYTRLFLGPVQALAKPYGSCWLSTPSPAADTLPSLAVLDLYNAGGFEIADEFRELPDHVAVELEFLYILTFNRNEAQRAGQADEALAVEQLERRFMTEHLGAWIGPFAAAIKSGAETAFYRELAELTERFIKLKD
jgi:putative dimethyl sulfoxide reductase chaperone